MRECKTWHRSSPELLAGAPRLAVATRTALTALRAAYERAAVAGQVKGAELEEKLAEAMRGVLARVQPLYDQTKLAARSGAMRVGANFEPQRLREGAHDIILGLGSIKTDPVRAILTIARGAGKIAESRRVAKYSGR